MNFNYRVYNGWYCYAKDYIGNVRRVYKVDINKKQYELAQVMNYYASGVPFDIAKNPDLQPYKYTGKEYVEEHGLEEYDNEARWYYPALARTTTMDPHCENYYDLSPYSWCGNNFVNVVDPDGADTVNINYNNVNNRWEISKPAIAEGNDVFNITGSDGTTQKFEFNKGKYGERVNFLNYENTGEGGYNFGFYHVSGASEGGTGFFVTPGGTKSNVRNSGKTIVDGIYPINPPFPGAEWAFPAVGGNAVERGSRFHYGEGDVISKGWTKGCFVLFSQYSIKNNRLFVSDLLDSQGHAITFSHLIGGIGTYSYPFTNSQGKTYIRTGVNYFPSGIQDKLIFRSLPR